MKGKIHGARPRKYVKLTVRDTGSGRSFTIYLPATERKVEEAVKPTERIINGIETILLVGDEERFLDVRVRALKKLGYMVLEARTGTEVVEVYKDNKDKIELVVLDRAMPRMVRTFKLFLILCRWNAIRTEVVKKVCKPQQNAAKKPD